MEKQRILISVKTYPTLSRKYGETVCTAGVREDGTWVRIYPVPFRRLDEEEQYSKYDWIECRLRRNDRDKRPESYSLVAPHEMKKVGSIDTRDNWRERRKLLLDRARIYDDLEEIIGDAKINKISLAVFKPARILDFIVEEDERAWDPRKLDEMRRLTRQHDLFDDNAWRKTFQLIPKLPYKFSYRFEDAAGRKSEQQILDWEIGALYWNTLRRAEGDESVAIEKVRAKYFDEFRRKDLHLYLGTTQRWHLVAPNPWLVIGVLPIPHQTQLGLF